MPVTLPHLPSWVSSGTIGPFGFALWMHESMTRTWWTLAHNGEHWVWSWYDRSLHAWPIGWVWNPRLSRWRTRDQFNATASKPIPPPPPGTWIPPSVYPPIVPPSLTAPPGPVRKG